MKVHTDLASFQGVRRPVLTTGTFDGVHQGHQRILGRLKETARREDGETVLFTFHPHPRMVLFPNDNDLRLLNTQPEKEALLAAAGIDHLLVVPFSRTFSRMRATDYIRDVLVEAIGVQAVVIGYDHRFGRNREGDIHLLRQMGDVCDFSVEEIPAKELEHVKVSSTKIRHALLDGDVRFADELLGYPYMLSGLVVKGEQLGRTLGFPTANIGAVESYKLIPGDGVYAVDVELRDGTYQGMLNIGQRPTVTSDPSRRTVEVNIFGLDRDLYGEAITVRFLDRIRPEIRHADIDALKEQLHKDRARALELMQS